MSHQYRISMLVLGKSFRGEISGGVGEADFPFVMVVVISTVDATISNQAFSHDRGSIFPGLNYNRLI